MQTVCVTHSIKMLHGVVLVLLPAGVSFASDGPESEC
jgi:hypothetical protein